MSEEKENKVLTPIKSIREYCLSCCCYSAKEVKECPSIGCPLYNFRLGKNPRRKKTITDEQRDKLRENLKKARSLKNKSYN